MAKHNEILNYKKKILGLNYYFVTAVIFLIGIVLMWLTSDQSNEFLKFLGKLGSFASAVVAVHFLHEKLVKDADREIIISSVKNAIQSGMNNFELKTVLYQNYKDVNWKELISFSEEKIVINVHYCDDWLLDYHELFVNYLSKEQSEITIFLPDPHDADLINRLSKLYPDLNEEVIKHRISQTIKQLHSLVTLDDKIIDRVKVFLNTHYYNYSRHSFDNIYIISLVEMYRINSSFMSPVISIQMDEFKKTEMFFDKEFQGLYHNSKLLNWVEYKYGSNPDFLIKVIDLTTHEGKAEFTNVKKDFLELMSRMYGDRYYGGRKIIKKLYHQKYCIFLMFDDNDCKKLIGCSYVSKKGKFSGLAVEKHYQGLKLAHKLIYKSFERIPSQFIEVKCDNQKLRKLLENCGFGYVNSVENVKDKLKISNEDQFFDECRFDTMEGKLIYTKTQYTNPKILSGDIFMMQIN